MNDALKSRTPPLSIVASQDKNYLLYVRLRFDPQHDREDCKAPSRNTTRSILKTEPTQLPYAHYAEMSSHVVMLDITNLQSADLWVPGGACDACCAC